MLNLKKLSALFNKKNRQSSSIKERVYHADTFAKLRAKWSEIPAGNERRRSDEILILSDEQIWQLWQEAHRSRCEGSAWDVSGWSQALYKDVLRDKRVLDVGSGLGLDALFFSSVASQITCLDISQANLEVIKRLCSFKGVGNIDTFYLEDLSSLDSLSGSYDVVWCDGSMICAPFEVARDESAIILQHLTPNGRWIELAYPRARWEREGSRPFSEWGASTDGEGTPWMEWYDTAKLVERLSPAKFEVVLAFEFHNSDYNWFDLQRIDDRTP
jgi:SAM-dependent methyltransferase